MTQLMLNPAEAAQFPSGLIVVEGDECSRYAAEGFGRSALDCPTMCQSSCAYLPPDRWAKLQGECPTCEGLGLEYEQPPGSTCLGDCPDCKGSVRAWIEFRAACPHDCQRFGGKVPGRDRGSNWDWVPCWCEGSGSVLVGYGEIDHILPVVRMGRMDTGERPCVMVENAATDTAWIVESSGHRAPITLDPLPRPGVDFVVTITNKETA